MKLSEILRAGKRRIVEHGWCQGDAVYLQRPKCCAATAMMPDSFDITEKGPFMFFRKVNEIDVSIGDWNDEPERTLSDVLAAYDKAIAAAEGEGR